MGEPRKASTSLQQYLLRYVQHFLDQTSQTAVSNGRSSIEERLARWLLMAADRLDDEELPLTHEFLAIEGQKTAGRTPADFLRRRRYFQKSTCPGRG